MSSGLAFPTVDMVMPTVTFPPPPPPVDAQALPHTGLLHTHGATSHLSAHAGDFIQHTVHQAGDAALQALGSLSGALLVGRAALLTTRVLAAAAVRAGEEQRCLERQQALAATAAEQWRDAAFAAVRVNARRRALLARVARAGAAGGPGGGPPDPDLPPPLEPVGEQLCTLRQRLARFEEDVRRAEERHAAWEQQRLGAELRLDDGDDAWQRALRESRRRALDLFTAERTAEAEERRLPRQTSDRAPRPAPDADEVRRAGAEILGGLDPYAVSEAAELAAGAVRHAVRRAAEDPRRARIHLNEARKYVRDANKDARLTREAQERAALHYDFLVYETPADAEDLAPAPEAVELLRRTLDDAVPLNREELAVVERAVEERRCALETIYVRDQCARAVEELARRFGGPTEAGRPAGQEIRLDWTPDGWGPGHWLRATVSDGALRVATMYRGGPERTPEQRALDDARCAQTPERLGELQRIIKDLGVDIEFDVRTEGALPGVPGEGAVSLDEPPARDDVRPEPAHHTGPRYKTADGDDRRRDQR
ncbi:MULTISPECIES: hypothetical protein [unclassified Streptomyces]|uniref:hypothetical protein n=1 Tax=unclassified Streptomyces TaxID=2593676 RepID=UPI00331ABDD2